MADILFEQAILNVVWGRQFIPEDDLQSICDTLSAGNSCTLNYIYSHAHWMAEIDSD